MEYTEIIIEAVSTLTINKLRTGLAVLGIVIGIGSVIALMSLGQSSKQAVQSQIQSIGSNLLTVSPGFQMQGNVRGAAGSSTALTYDDAIAIANSPEITTIKYVSPEYSDRVQVIAGINNTNTQITGVTPVYAMVRKLSVSSGSFITDRNITSLSKVAVLGPTVAIDLFGEGVDPVGQSVRINGQTFQVIGITASKGGSGFQNQDDMIFVPLTTAQKQLFGVKSVTSIALEAKSEDMMVDAQNEVGFFLLARHKLTNPEEADFRILSQQDILNAASSITGTFTALLSGIAAISLLVGGIGIMNIMLVTVTERTREIGLRKALGAKKRVIIIQFLFESIILTVTGGLIGMMIGIGISYLLSRSMSLPFAMSASSVVLAIGVSGGIGILFGWYPARKAANLQPIEALRYE